MIKRYAICNSSIAHKSVDRRTHKLADQLHIFCSDVIDILYAPLVGSIYIVDKELSKSIRNNNLTDDQKDLLIDNELMIPADVNILPHDELNQDKGLAVFMTSACNLRCEYCFAKGGDDNISVNLQKIYAVLKEKGNINFISFHGGGEPTLKMDKIKRITNYVRSRGNEPTLDISTNGVMALETMQYLVKQNFIIKISYDGLADIQVRQRPTLQGNDSSQIIERNIQLLPENRRITQTTVTEYNVERLLEILEHLISLGVSRMKFELVNYAGRASDDNAVTRMPDLDVFRDSLMKTFEVAHERNIIFESSLITLDKRRRSHCDMTNPLLGLTPDGFISTCFWATKYSSESEPFLFGRYDENGMTIDIKKLKLLQSRTVDNIKGCQDCYLKYTCAGGCAYDSFLNSRDIFTPTEKICQLRRLLNEDAIRYLASRHLIRIRPYILHTKTNEFWQGYFIKHELNRDLFKFNLSPTTMSETLKVILKKKKDMALPILFILTVKNFFMTKCDSKVFTSFMSQLDEHKIYYRIADPIHRCYFNILPQPVYSRMPKGCIDCIFLYTVNETDHILFCNGTKGKRKVNEYPCREAIFEEFAKTALCKSECTSCLHYIRKNCTGSYCS